MHSSSNSLPSALSPALLKIAQANGSAINDALDLKLLLEERKRPGECMQCLFNLYRKAPRQLKAEVETVKTCLQQNIEVVATDEDARELCRFPCEIREEHLEDYCLRMMEESKRQIGSTIDSFQLEFRYCA